ADGIVRPFAGALYRAQRRRVELAQFPAVLRIDAQSAAVRGRGRDVSGQVQRHGQDEAQIVVGVLADQIDPARRPEHTRLLCGAEVLAEGSDHESSCFDNLLSPSMMRPDASITSPQYRFTLESVSAARSDGANTPIPTRIRPTMEKKKPVGTLKSSMSGEPEVKK